MTAVALSTASAELTTAPIRSRCPRPSASAMNRVTPACRPRSEMLRYPADTEKESARTQIAVRAAPEVARSLGDDEEVGEQGEDADRAGDERVAEDAAPVRDLGRVDGHAGWAASRCARYRSFRSGRPV